jgi:hypothetical protein
MRQAFASKALPATGGGRLFKRFALAASLAALSLSVGASSAGAAVTIGQIAPANPPQTCSGAHTDLVQPTVTSGNTYVVPALPPATSLVINSWSHSAFNGPNQEITMKVWRHVTGMTYRAVGHDGPRAPNPGVVNSFSGISVPVQPGDVLGLNRGIPASNCVFSAPGDTFLLDAFSNAADGETATFSTGNNFRVNASAVVTPSNAFTLGAVTRNKKKGTATLNVNVPNPGDLSGSGNGAKVAGAAGAVTSKAVGAGNAQLLIKAKGKKKKKLNQKGKVKLNVAVTYTPTGGEPSTQSIKVKLKKKL